MGGEGGGGEGEGEKRGWEGGESGGGEEEEEEEEEEGGYELKNESNENFDFRGAVCKKREE